MLKKKKTWLIFAATILIMVVACEIYIGDYYRAEHIALESIDNPDKDITVIENKDERIVFTPKNPECGFVFYPGGKVEYKAYAPLMEELATQGVLCVLLHMPGNLAVLDANAAEGIQEDFPDVEEWYIGGHSLGGTIAANYLESQENAYRGLILLASYSTKDLSNGKWDVLSVLGTEDKVLNAEAYEENKANLPKNMKEFKIEGGCHAYFGAYGEQKGDGIPKITHQEQIEITVKAIMEFIKNN